MSEKSYERITVKDQDGNSKVTWERPIFGDLVVKNEGGRTIIEKTGVLGVTKTYMPSESESVEAENW
jgi:hypothetical protein